MNRKTRILLALALVAAVVGYRAWQRQAPKAAPKASAYAAEPAPERKLGRIAFKPCTLSPALGAASVEAECGTFSVAENPSLPNGRKIALNIAWVPANDSGDHVPDPVFMLAGGPGQAAAETYPQIAPAFREVLKHRDVILVDQRGTGKSNKLICKDSEGKSAVVDKDDYQLEAAKAELERVEAGESTADRWQLEQRIKHAENQLAVSGRTTG